MQRLADRVCNVFVPAVLLIALATLAAWLWLGYAPVQAFTAALSVLVIACPCALGLATPAALYVAAGEGARAGIFFKGYRALEASQEIDTVVLDKTGTVTTGKMKVTDIACAPGTDARTLLRWAGALEQASEHPAAVAIASRAMEEVGPLPVAQSFIALPGFGATGTVEGHDITVGRIGAEGNGRIPRHPAWWIVATGGRPRVARRFSSRATERWSGRWHWPTPSASRRPRRCDSFRSSGCGAFS